MKRKLALGAVLSASAVLAGAVQAGAVQAGAVQAGAGSAYAAPEHAATARALGLAAQEQLVVKDTVVDGETGRVVPHGDVGALAGAMMAAVSDPVGRARMEERAIERARGYTWDAAATATVDVLVEAARGAGAQ